MFNLLRLSSVQVRLLIRRELFKECQIVRQLQLVVVVELIWDEKNGHFLLGDIWQ